MDSKTALRGARLWAGTFARSIATTKRSTIWLIRPLSFTSSGQHGLECDQNTKTYFWTCETGLVQHHEYPRRPDQRQMHVRDPPQQNWHQECYDRSALPRNPAVYVPILVVLLGWEINVCPTTSSYSRPHSRVALPPSCMAVRELSNVGSC
jgi:hypothetical protein